jgi:hypothetical protein
MIMVLDWSKVRTAEPWLQTDAVPPPIHSCIDVPATVHNRVGEYDPSKVYYAYEETAKSRELQPVKLSDVQTREGIRLPPGVFLALNPG